MIQTFLDMLTSRSAKRAGVKQVLQFRAPVYYGPFTTSRVTVAATQNDAAVAPVDIPKLAKMAQIKVTEQEVSGTACCRYATHAGPYCQPSSCCLMVTG